MYRPSDIKTSNDDSSSCMNRDVEFRCLQRMRIRNSAKNRTYDDATTTYVVVCSRMASKSVKAQLKAAKAAVGRKEFQEVARICQVRTANN